MLGEQRSIRVHLPEDYYPTTQAYPVLYLLDGEGHFKYVSKLVNYLSDYDRNRISQTMVVAVLNDSARVSITYGARVVASPVHQ